MGHIAHLRNSSHKNTLAIDNERKKYYLFFKNWWPWFVKTFISFTKFGLDWPGDSSEDCLISSMYFRYFHVTFPWNRAGHFISTHMNSLYPRMFCAKFGWNQPGGSGEEEFFLFRQCISAISLIYPLGNRGALHLNKLNSLHQRMRCDMQGWMNLA